MYPSSHRETAQAYQLTPQSSPCLAESPSAVPAMTPHPNPSLTKLGFFQDPSPQPLKLKEVFTLFQIQYNRSYSSPAGITDSLHLWSKPPPPI